MVNFIIPLMLGAVVGGLYGGVIWAILCALASLGFWWYFVLGVR